MQTTFIEIAKIRTQYRLKKKKEYIIKELVREIQPLEMRKVVRGLLAQNGRTAKKANKKITHFHDLVMKLAVKAEEAAALGLTTSKTKKEPTKPPKREREQDKRKGRNGRQRQNQSNPKGEEKTEEQRKKERAQKEKTGVPRGDKGCAYCGGNHFVAACPKVPPEKKKLDVATAS